MNLRRTDHDLVQQSASIDQRTPPDTHPNPPLSPQARVSGGPCYHYIVVRADLTKGQQLAQTVHAAGESVREPVPAGTHAVVLSVPNEEWLLAIADRLSKAQIDYKLIIEPDLPTDENSPLADGQGTAIGISPTYDRSKVSKVLGQLPLLR